MLQTFRPARPHVAGASVPLRKAINGLGKGDVLIVCRLGRLARSMRDLLNVLHEISERGASFGRCIHPGQIPLVRLVGLCSRY
jgi:hypothetical protein